MAISEDFTAIVMAAGKGTRMKSPLPKVLHPVAGVPMISKVIEALKEAGAKEVRVVVGHGEALVRQVVEPLGAVCFKQEQQRGTADAVRAAQPESIKGTVLIINGDHPLIKSDDISNMIKEFCHGSSDLSVISSKIKKPGSFGRIVRHHGELRAIVEAKDASSETLKINEINTGIYITDSTILNEYLPQIQSNNAQGEFYFTDIVSLCHEDSKKISAIISSPRVAFGVNSQMELAKATKFLFKRKNKELLENGVVIIDPDNTYIEDDVEVGEATVIYPGAYLRSGTRLGQFCVVEPNCYLVKARIEDSVHIKVGTHIEDTKVGTKSLVGPYARLRPGTVIGKKTKIGNFVEMKKVNFADGAQASHLAYLGDAEIGEGTNIGCGTITCNYAANKKKYVTKIGKNTFVGSDSQFVAPVTVGDNVVIGSGSTITKNVPDGSLAVARGKQYIKENYQPKSPEEPKKES